jgi:Response regulator of the LytR/AlgR family
MTVALIDDEQLALKMMEILLSKYPKINITGQFMNPVKALEEIPTLQPDIVFLDIDMPCMNGMNVAAGILEASPNTRIIFVTAHEEYGLDAYQYHPMDYILKPVDEERLEKLIEYLQRSNQKIAVNAEKKFWRI